MKAFFAIIAVPCLLISVASHAVTLGSGAKLDAFSTNVSFKTPFYDESIAESMAKSIAQNQLNDACTRAGSNSFANSAREIHKFEYISMDVAERKGSEVRVKVVAKAYCYQL